MVYPSEKLVKDTLDNVVNSISKEANVFCLNSGNVDVVGNADLIEVSPYGVGDNLNLSFKVGNGYKSIVGTLASGKQFTRSSIPDMELERTIGDMVNIATPENAISSGCNNSANNHNNAFDGNTSSWWFVNYQGASVINNGYIGQSNIVGRVEKIRVMQDPTNQGYGLPSFKIQYLSGSTWVDIQQYSNTAGLTNNWEEIILEDYNVPTEPYSIRLLATSYPYLGNYHWLVAELEMYIQPISCQHGNLFIGESGNAVLLDNTITKDKKAPEEPQENDVWVDTSVMPYQSYKYDGEAWQEWEYVPFAVVDNDGVATTLAYNPVGKQRYSAMPDYKNGVHKPYQTWILAQEDCVVCLCNYNSPIIIQIKDPDGNFIPTSCNTGDGGMARGTISASSVWCFVPKGYSYYCTAGSINTGDSPIEYPLMKGDC